MNCLFCKPFILTIIQNDGGWVPLVGSTSQPSTELPHPIARACPEQPRDPPVFTFLRTLLRVFALSRNSTLFFSSGSALFAQNTRGGGSLFACGRLPQREQHGLGRRAIGNLLQLRVLPAKRLGHFHFRALPKADYLPRVYHGLS